jgi:hypothetical protein
VIRRAGISFFILLLALSSLACNLPVQISQIFATPTPIPTPIPLPTATPTPDPVARIVEKVVTEDNPQERFTIKAVYPFLDGFQPYNLQLTRVMENSLKGFRMEAAEANSFPSDTLGSFLETTYETKYNQAWLFSVQILTNAYIKGAAHPGSFFTTLNYDLKSDRMLALADLFQPGSAYLDVIANFCKSELRQRNIAYSSDGADPKEENYRQWLLTSQGLLIVFNEYQVAAYAAGPQTILIPYAQLKSILKPGGPVSRILK